MNKRQFICVSLLFMFAAAGCERPQTGDSRADLALQAFNTIVKENSSRKSYHNQLKHWGLALPGGDKFEWIKDASANKIDFAMVLEAAPFIKAGLDVNLLAGTSYVFKPAATEQGKIVPDLLIYPFTRIKIARTLVDKLQQDNASQYLIVMLIQFAHKYNMSVTAEGVETAQQRDILRDIECQNVQGYFFSYPLREREVLSAFAKEVIEEGLCNV